jgi:Spy/CpxP family protein refolding chaperone
MNKVLKNGITAVAIAAVLAFAGSELSAQKNQDRPRDGKGTAMNCPQGGGQSAFHLNRMQEHLGLTDQQVDKIFKIETEYRQKFYDNRKNPEKTAALRDAQKAEIDKVLTDEQKKKIQDAHMNMKGKHGGKKGKGYCPYGN